MKNRMRILAIFLCLAMLLTCAPEVESAVRSAVAEGGIEQIPESTESEESAEELPQEIVEEIPPEVLEEILSEPAEEILPEAEKTSDDSAEESEEALPKQEEIFADSQVTFSLDRAEAVIYPGDKGLRLTPVFSDGEATNVDGTPRTVTFATSSSKIATVAASGVVTGKKTGKVTITATAFVEGAEMSASCAVKVAKKPKKVSVNPAKIELMTGEEVQTNPVFASGYGSTCTFTTADTDIATVDEFGVLRGVSKGRTTLNVRTYNGMKGKAQVTVYVPATDIAFKTDELTLGEGMSRKLEVVFPEYERDEYSFTVHGDEGCVEVLADGTLCALKKGMAEVIARTANGCEDVCFVTVKSAPNALYLSGKDTIGVGESMQLTTRTEPEDLECDVTFTSSNVKVATVDENGVVTGKKSGNVTIYAMTYNEIMATFDLTVKKAPTSVKLSIPRTVLGVEESVQTSYTLSKGSAGSVTAYNSSNPDVATVDENGVVHAVGIGKTKIKCRTYNKKVSNTITVEVRKAPSEITPKTDAIRLGKDDSCVLGYALGENETGAVEFSSSNPEIATVDEDGRITAVQTGTALITLTPFNHSCFATCEVTVVEAPEALAINGPQTIGVGEKFQIASELTPEDTVSAITYTSGNSKVATVSKTGLVTGKKAGSATIYAETYNHVVDELELTVKKAPTSVKLSIPRTTLGVEESVPTSYKLSDGSAGSVTKYITDVPGVVEIDENGVVTAIGEGEVKIKCYTYNNRASNVLKVTVGAKPTQILLDQTYFDTCVGESDLVIGYHLGEGEAGGVRFTSSNENVAIVDENGRVYGVSTGTATITLSTYVEGVTASCTVAVNPEPVGIDLLGLTSMIIAKGDMVDLPEAIPYDEYGNKCDADVTFTTSNKKYVQISGGKLVGVAAGKATITAKVFNGVSATFTVTVSKDAVSVSLSANSLHLFLDEESGYVEDVWLETDVKIGGKTGVTSLSVKSSDPSVASVGLDGNYVNVGAVSPGTATITVTAAGKNAKCTVKVDKLTSQIRFEPSSYALGVNMEADLHPIFDPGTSAEIASYVSSDPSCVTVDENGHIAAMALGSATITATDSTGLRTATVPVKVLPGPDKVFFNASLIQMRPGESLMLNPRFHSQKSEFCEILEYVSLDESIATVDQNGRLTAKKVGTTAVGAVACNGAAAACVVTVQKSGSVAGNGLLIEEASIVAGDSADMSMYIALDTQAYANGYTLTSSDPMVLSVEDGCVIAKKSSAKAVALTMEINGTGETSACAIDVVSGTKIEATSNGAAISNNQIELHTYSAKNPQASQFPLEVRILPSDSAASPFMIGTCDVVIANEDLLTYEYKVGDDNAMVGTLRAGSVSGTTTVSVVAYDKTKKLTVNIEPTPRYRALIIGEYNGVSGISNNLPFAKKNCDFMRSALSKSSSLGETYSITYNASNPTKSKVKSLIQNTFAAATDDDVSLIYIVSHGYIDGAKNYYFGIPAAKTAVKEMVYSDELLDWMSGIKGNVILILASCKSGGFLDDCKSRIAARGKLSVLTAQTGDKSASFYLGADSANTMEFLTYAFTKGLGYNAGYETPGYYADANKDGVITISEAINYGKSETEAQVKKYKSKWVPFSLKSSGFMVPSITTKAQLNEWSQKPQTYLSGSASSTPLFVYDPSKK